MRNSNSAREWVRHLRALVPPARAVQHESYRPPGRGYRVVIGLGLFRVRVRVRVRVGVRDRAIGLG